MSDEQKENVTKKIFPAKMSRRKAITTMAKVAVGGAVVVVAGAGVYLVESNKGPSASTSSSSSSSSTSSSSSSTSSVNKYSGSMKIATYAAINNLDPQNGTTPGVGFFDNVFDTLFALSYAPTSKPGTYKASVVNRLAQSYTVSSDGLTYTIKLQPNVMWHNGQPLTSKDAVWAFTRLKTTAKGASFLPYLTTPAVVDNLTFTLPMSQPWVPTLTVLASYNCAIIAHPDTLGVGLANYDPAKTYQSPQNVMGTGPFKFVSQQPGVNEILTRNTNYWMKDTDGSQLPYLDGITYLPTTDPTARLTAFQSGSVDCTHEIASSSVSTVQGMQNANLSYMPWQGMVCILFNQTSGKVLSNPALRQALFKCVDKNAIDQATWGGVADLLVTPIPSYDPNFYDPAGTGVIAALDIAGAQKLLQAAGYSASNPLNLTLVDVNSAGIDQPTDTIFQASCKQAGINLSIQSEDLTTWVGDVFTKRNFDIAMHSLSYWGEPTVTINRYFGSKAPDFTTYNSATLDSLISQSGATSDPTQRASIFQQMQTEIYNNFAWVPIAGFPEIFAYYNYLNDVASYDWLVNGYDFRKAWTTKKS